VAVEALQTTRLVKTDLLLSDAADAERYYSSFELLLTSKHIWTKKLSRCYSPLKPAELQVLRDQYEKEGEYVGIQTKFNYAWVFFLLPLRYSHTT